MVVVVLVGLNAGLAYGQLDVWIDPGHGGHDPGALGINGAATPNEKELNIGVTSYLENDLTGLGFFVYRTQNTDSTFFSPADRARIANGDLANDQGIRVSCRLLVSVHMNSAGDDAVFGTETYYATLKYGAKKKNAYLTDKTAAHDIHADLMTYANVAFLFCSNDRGTKAKNYAVLKRTRAPALLIEVCFISNACQFNNIVTSGDQALIADGIAAGVSQYLPALLDPPAPLESATPVDGPSRKSPQVSAAVLQEDFESATFPPSGWSIQTAGLGVPYAWHRTTDSLYVCTGSGSALVGGESPASVDEWLISPSVALAGTDRTIKFSWSGSEIWSSVLDASLNIRQVGNPTWSPLWSLSNDEPPADAFIYRERAADLTPWNGMTVEFGFRVAGANGADFAIDNIAVGDFNPTADAPNDVCSNATPLGSTFSIDDVTCYAANDLNPFTPPPGSCVGNTLDGPDVFYRLDVAFGDSVHAMLTSQWGGGLYIIDDCIDPDCVAGAYAEDGRTSSTLDYRFVNAGTYYLVVDGEGGSCGPYQLDGDVTSTLTGIGGERAAQPLNFIVHPNPGGGPIAFLGEGPSSLSATPIIEIYNVAGERVLQVAGVPGSSEFSYMWDLRAHDGSPVASGMYFARLKIGGREVVQKFVILR